MKKMPPEERVHLDDSPDTKLKKKRTLLMAQHVANRKIPAYLTIKEQDFEDNAYLTLDSDYDPEPDIVIKYYDFIILLMKNRHVLKR